MNMNDLLNNINEIEEDIYLDDNIVNILSYNRELLNNKSLNNIKLVIELYIRESYNNIINNNKRIKKIINQLYDSQIYDIINRYHDDNMILIMIFNNKKHYIKINGLNHFKNLLIEYYNENDFIINYVNLYEL